MTLRVRVDGSKCQGHNRCYVIAPELYDLNELGNAHEKNDGIVPKELEEEARLSVLNCPERAIILIEEDNAKS